VNLAALKGRVASERRPDRLGKSLRAVDDEKTRNGWIEAALDEIVDQCRYGRRVFRGALDQPERMLVAIRIDADRRYQPDFANWCGYSRFSARSTRLTI